MISFQEVWGPHGTLLLIIANSFAIMTESGASAYIEPCLILSKKMLERMGKRKPGDIPEDSKHDDTQLELSKKGFHQYDKRITSRSAGQVFYIGDWHSHPSVPLIMSDLDIETCRKRVLPAMQGGIGICIITKVKETKAFLVSDKL